jgi:gas vesicle protein
MPARYKAYLAGYLTGLIVGYWAALQARPRVRKDHSGE